LAVSSRRPAESAIRTAPHAPFTDMILWLKRIGYTIGAIVAVLLIIISFVYG
jgi:hypothetical protein